MGTVISFIHALASSKLLLDLYRFGSCHQLDIFMWLPRYCFRDLLRLELIQPPLKMFVCGTDVIKAGSGLIVPQPPESPNANSFSTKLFPRQPKAPGEVQDVGRNTDRLLTSFPRQPLCSLMSFVQGSQMCLNRVLASGDVNRWVMKTKWIK